MPLKTKEPCKTPGCNHPNWHLCTLDKTKPNRFPELLRRDIAHREKNRELVDKIIDMYKVGDKGMQSIADELGIGKDRVLRILRAAQDDGLVEIRPRGVNLTKRGRKK